MCVLYVSFGSNVRPGTFGCVAMGSAVLFISRSRLLIFRRVWSASLLCFVKTKTLCRYGCMYIFLVALVRVDVILISSAMI